MVTKYQIEQLIKRLTAHEFDTAYKYAIKLPTEIFEMVLVLQAMYGNSRTEGCTRTMLNFVVKELIEKIKLIPTVD